MRAALLGGIGIGAASVVLAAVLALDIDLAGSGVLPGGPVVGVVGWVGLAALVLALFTAAGRWTPSSAGCGALQGRAARASRRPGRGGVPRRDGGVRRDRHVAAVPLVIPALGCVALAIVAVPERPSRRRDPIA